MNESIFDLSFANASAAEETWNISTTTLPTSLSPSSAPPVGVLGFDGVFNESDVTLATLRNLSRACSPYLYAAFEIFNESGVVNRSTAREIFSLCPELVDSSDIFYWEELAPALIVYS